MAREKGYEMRRLSVVFLAAASVLVLSASAPVGGASPEAITGGEITAEDFDPSLFDDNSATIDNEWLPLQPGTRFVYRGSTEEDGERVPRRIVLTVTDLTKVISGVRAFVGWERDWSGGKLIESELFFLAQDKDGNVWHLGEYAETWEEGDFVGGQAWLVGHLEGAKAGIFMKAEPRLGTPAYSEGFAPAPYYWNDFGKVFKTGQKTCVPAGCFEDVLVIDEFEPSKPGAHQLKYYARGVGNVRVGWRGKDPDKEVLVLDRVVHLSPEAMATARAKALELETRAYVYGLTPPAEQWPIGDAG